MKILTLKIKTLSILSLEGLHYLAKHFVLQFFFILDLEYFDIPFLHTFIIGIYPSKEFIE